MYFNAADQSDLYIYGATFTVQIVRLYFKCAKFHRKGDFPGFFIVTDQLV